eukprot:CAMPEP_0206381292 /NCGR_PEP_ID=MMETSP0294-20121207/12560_1 /ASSEMBLY_ACC=CAM_ASM_000327 /TAXON_ID=39354 /ORGANISM="Heterosigma akashiwo, Strain CCMP2393" /LENGTH=117 /DNA_ID=CAMNT_0053830719 /DNA_START=240 /DNA_END=593 /DNA_ORIENTATION=+
MTDVNMLSGRSKGPKRYLNTQGTLPGRSNATNSSEQEAGRQLFFNHLAHTRVQETRELLTAVWIGEESTGGPWREMFLKAIQSDGILRPQVDGTERTGRMPEEDRGFAHLSVYPALA